MKARILIVGLERALFDKIDPLLSRSHFVVDRVPRGESAVVLSGHVGFDLMIIRHPLPDLALEVFCGFVRGPSSPSAGSQLLVLTEDARTAEARAIVPTGPGLVLSLNEPGRLLEEVASRLLGVAPRVSTRLMIRLEVRILGEGKSLMMAQSENVSEGGMLLRTDRLIPVGTRVGFETMLPGDRAPLQGEGEIVRHCVADVEKVQGIGLKILGFRGDGLKRFHDFVAKTG